MYTPITVGNVKSIVQELVPYAINITVEGQAVGPHPASSVAGKRIRIWYYIDSMREEVVTRYFEIEECQNPDEQGEYMCNIIKAYIFPKPLTIIRTIRVRGSPMRPSDALSGYVYIVSGGISRVEKTDESLFFYQAYWYLEKMRKTHTKYFIRNGNLESVKTPAPTWLNLVIEQVDLYKNPTNKGFREQVNYLQASDYYEGANLVVAMGTIFTKGANRWKKRGISIFEVNLNNYPKEIREEFLLYKSVRDALL